MSIGKLLSIATPAISTANRVEGAFLDGYEKTRAVQDLLKMLALKNGFYAFEAALHVFPWISTSQADVMGLQEWNRQELWREWYQGCIDGFIFFAEDIFGVQFAIKGDVVISFDPESSEVEEIAGSIEEWANKLLLRYPQLTGYPLAHSWQSINGPIPVGKRLLPKIPFVLGGAYDVANLYAVDAVKGMRYRGDLWLQLRDLPDGAQVQLKVLPLQ